MATTDETINFQGKIVRNDTGYEGLNVTTGTPACVVAGVSNDTCDFRIKYYSVATGGSALGTEVFSNVEIGTYLGVFNLVLGTGTFSAGTETSFRNVFINNSSIYFSVEFAPDGSTYTETFLDAGGNRMGARAAAFAFTSGGASKQFQFDPATDGTGYSNVTSGQVFYDSDDNVLRVYNGSEWLAIVAYSGSYSSLWTLNTTPTPDIISSYTGLDVAMGGSTSTSPFFFDDSAQLVTLTNTTGGLSFVVNDQLSDTTPFVIDTDGDVGIGTSTPGTKLEVQGGRTVLVAASEEYTLGIGNSGGAGKYWLGVDASATPSLKFKNTGGNDRLIVADSGLMTSISSDSIESGLILKRSTTDATHIEWKMLGQTNNKDFWITAFNGTTTRNFMKFYWDTSSVNFDTGNVGIGVATPGAFLGIKAATTSSAQINLTTSAGVDPSAPNSGDMWWNGTNLYFFDGSTNTDLLSGGSGTGSLFTDAGDVTYLTSTSDDLALGGIDSTAPFFFDEGNELLVLTNTTAGLSFRVNDVSGDTTPFVIDADGNVGIGTATPGAKLDIAGTSSTISNAAGDITIDSYSGYISFAGDSLSNVLDATFSGNINVNGGQIQLPNHAVNPTAVGEGSIVYNSTDKKLYYYKDTGWADVGKVYTGTANQTFRHNGTDWEASSALQNDGTDITATGQVRVGNYATKPTGIGAGAMVYDTALGSLFVYDGATWRAISTAQVASTNGSVSNGSYLELTHNFNTNDLLASGWLSEAGVWKEINADSKQLKENLQNQWDKAATGGLIRTQSRLTNLELKPSVDVGTGADGAGSVGASTTITLDTGTMVARACADAINYNVATSGLTSTSATLTSTPATNCLAAGDEVLLINLQGTNSAFVNVGNYETLRVLSVSTSTVNFVTSKINYYGDNATDDSNIGTTAGTQRVMLQRVPNYTTVSVASTGILTSSAWNGVKGGVLFFRATGAISVVGSVSVNTLGYKGGDSLLTSGTNNYAGRGGESFCGLGGQTFGANGAAGAGGGTGGNGYCGGGGTGSGGGGTGSANQGGAGAGGQLNSSSGGGGGGGGYGTGGYNSGGATQAGANSSNNGSTTIAGGGGSYGNAGLTKLFFGSGGGFMGAAYGYGAGAAPGGTGGGIAYISGGSVSVSGTISSTGGTGSNAGSASQGGAGGAAGGSVYILGNTITLGTNLVTATQGYGGAGNGGSNGGNGGYGRVAISYTTSYSGSSNSPTPTYAQQPYYPYGLYHSAPLAIPNAMELKNIRWDATTTAYGKIAVQTRTGNTATPTDGTWEGWKPYTVTTNYLVLQSADTHTDWTGTNATVAEGDVTRNVDYFEDEDEATAGNLTKITSSTNGGYAGADTVSTANLSTYDYITFWVRASQTGNTVKFGFGETVATEQEMTITIDAADTWQKVYWDISGISSGSRDTVAKLRLTNLTTASNTIYLDNVRGEVLLTTSSGSAITSTRNNYLQYRVIFTTTNTSYIPLLLNITIEYNSGYKIELTDVNTTRLYNYSGSTQTLRIIVSASGGGAGSLDSGWTQAGGNIYRATGNVGIGDATPDTTLKVVGSLCVKSDANNCAGSTAGTIYANNLSIQSADLAENYEVSDNSIAPGDVVSVSTANLSEVIKSNPSNESNIMGVISTSPGLVMNDSLKENGRAVALIGRVPIKVIAGSLNIKVGDPLGVSPIEGYGTTMKFSGFTVAKSLENTLLWNEQTCPTVETLNNLKWLKDTGKNDEHPCFKIQLLNFTKDVRESLAKDLSLLESDYLYVGKIIGYVSVSWYQPTWMTEGLEQMVNNFNGSDVANWVSTDTQLTTSKDIIANSFSANSGQFNILSGGILNIGNGNFSVDTGGNVGIAGDMVISGMLKGKDGSVLISLGDSLGKDLFAVQNSNGKTVFSVDSQGEVGGEGLYKSDWIKVDANSQKDVAHNFGKQPSEVNMVVSENSNGNGFTAKGVGTSYYFEATDDNTIRIVNTTNKDIFVKLTIAR
jgi:hypothetical protein